MIVRVEITPRPETFDARGHEVAAQAPTLGVEGLRRVAVHDVFYLGGSALTEAHVQTLVDRILLDPVVSTATWEQVGAEPAAGVEPGVTVVEVAPLAGTTDSEAESLRAAAQDVLQIAALEHVATGTRYLLEGDLSSAQVERLARGLLANEVVEAYAVDQRLPPQFVQDLPEDLTVERVPLRGLSDASLLEVSKDRRLSLDLNEMRQLRSIFEAEGREPTDAELEMFAQTWSEHCVHKTFKAHITFTEDGITHEVDSLFKTYIAGATDKVRTPWLESVFVDDAGIVGFEEGWSVAFKVETHNHPSALEPFGGANTGVGGVIRDVIAVSARPIATTDVLCFGPPDLDPASLPEGVLHPRRIADGVIAGVGDYGNKMGIPTVNGAILYDPGYTANPLVYCGCLGVLRSEVHRTEPQPGDRVVVMGGRTGRDGLRGATFSSMEMDTSTADIAGSSVQIGHPIHEKQVLEAIMQARDEGLYNAITDCGAGGLSSSIGEMGEELGARIHLERVPLKYAGLRPWEIWLSEAQERMVLAVPDAHWARVQEICAVHHVEVVSLGTFTGDGRLRITHGDVVVADLAMTSLHEGIPQRRMTASWTSPTGSEPELGQVDPRDALLSMLATPDIRSKEDVVRTYDHEVQGGTVVKPFVGPSMDGPSDATVLRPLDVVQATGQAGGKGVALSVGIRPAYGKIDPEAMAWAVVDEAVRNLVAVGADPTHIALLDNFCWGNPNLPDRLGALVRCARGCHDAAVSWGAPFISGKDSLNNEYTGADGAKHAIPGTLLISALGLVPDVDRTVTMDLKQEGHRLYLVGATANELGGSALYELHGELGLNVPRPRIDGPKAARAMHAAIQAGQVVSAHDLSEGGLAVALAEMGIAGHLGARVELASVPWEGEGRSDLALLFSESLTRWLVEVPVDHASAFEATMAGVSHAAIGEVTTAPWIRVVGVSGEPCLEASLSDLREAWRGHVVRAAPGAVA